MNNKLFKTSAMACCLMLLPTVSVAQELSAPTPGNLIESYQAWRVECNTIKVPVVVPKKAEREAETEQVVTEEVAQPETRQICNAYQNYTNNKTGNEIARFIFSYTADKKGKKNLIAGIRTLVDISFETKPKVVVGEVDLVEGQFIRCSGNYCFTRFDMKNEAVKKLQDAKAATFQYPLSSGRTIRVNMSTAGLSDALASLKSKQAN